MEEGGGVGANAVFVAGGGIEIVFEGLDEKKKLDCDQGLQF